MSVPAAEVEITEELVRALLEEQQPDLAGLPITRAAHGWDNAILRLGDTLVVRIPRRAAAVPLIEHEQRWLPQLAERLDVAVPVPLRRGVPGGIFPWPWTVAAWLPGTVVAHLAVAERAGLVDQLAGFLRDLHQHAPPEAPRNPVRGVPLAARAEVVSARIASGLVPGADELAAVWQASLAAPGWSGPAVWLHADLHPANLVSDQHRLAAVLDFGDLTAGDPATDLAAAWLTFDVTARTRFRALLPHDDATWTRARGWALVLGTALVSHSADAPLLHAIGVHALAQALLD